MTLPEGATVEIIIVFFAVLILTLLFSTLYLRRYLNNEADRCSIVTAVIALTIVLITSALTPIDIFVVSYMKTDQGVWKDWAKNLTERIAIEDGVLYTYYTFYSLVFICIFLVIPFAYFFYEEKNEDGFDSENRVCNAIKFTLGFLFAIVALLLIGAFVPLKETPDQLNPNSTHWEKLKFLINELEKNRGEDAISMVLNILTVFGMANLVLYTGFGIFSWPVGLIRGTRSAKQEFEEIQDKHLVNQTRINTLRDKERVHGRLSPREKRQLSKLEEDERQILREEQLLDEHRRSLRYKCRVIVRPVEIFFGVFYALVGLVIWLSLLLANIDKALHSLGMKMGYMLPKSTIPNPVDLLLTQLQKIFPLDYIAVLIITWFFVFATVSGIRNLGVRVCGIKLYKLRVKRTEPQGLLLTCAILMLTVLAFNIVFFSLTPQYATYGSEHYVSMSANSTNGNGTEKVDLKHVLKPCSDDAKSDDCIFTRNSALILRFFYKAWIFGAIYYWATWAFLAFSLLSFLYLIIRKSRSVTHGLLDEDELEDAASDDFGHR